MSDIFRIQVENKIVELMERMDVLENELKKKVSLEFFNTINENRRKEIKDLQERRR